MHIEYYQLQISRIQTGCSFLWGPVRNALLLECRNGNEALIYTLCFTDEQLVKEMLVDVLLHLGRDNLPQLETILHLLIPATRPATSAYNLRRLLRPSLLVLDDRRSNAQQIAIDVASSLSVTWVLEATAFHPSSAIQTAAVRYIYYLWQRDMVTGFTLLNHITNETIRTIVPSPKGLESLLSLSLIILFDQPQNFFVHTSLQDIWRWILGHILGVTSSKNWWKTQWSSFRRDRIFSLTINILFRILEEMPDFHDMNYHDLAAFFQLDTAAKQLYQNLVSYINVDGSYSPAQMEKDIFAALDIDNVLMEYIVGTVFHVHAMQEPLNLIPLLRRFFVQAQAHPIPNAYLSVVLTVLGYILSRDSSLDEVFQFYIDAIDIYHEYYSKHPKVPGRYYVNRTAAARFSSDYIIYHYRRTGSVNPEWVQAQIMRLRNHSLLLDYFFEVDLPLIGIEVREPEIALETLAAILPLTNLELDHLIARFLSRLRMFYPTHVDDFLEAYRFSPDQRLTILANQRVETVGELIGSRALTFLMNLIEQSPSLRAEVIHILGKAAELPDVRIWLKYTLRRIINVIYGQEII